MSGVPLGAAFIPIAALLLRLVPTSRGERLPPPASRGTWRILLPREARFGVPEAAAWFASLAPLLPSAESLPSVELESADRALIMRVSASASWEAPLRAQLAVWFPGARLETEAQSPPTGNASVQPLRFVRPDLYPLRLPHAGEPDPLLGFLGTLMQDAEPCGLRITWGAPPDDWGRWAPTALQAERSGGRLPPRGRWLPLYLAYHFLRASEATSPTAPRSSRATSTEWERAAAKVRDTVFGVHLSVWAVGAARTKAERRVRELAAQLSASYRDSFGNALVAAGAPQGVASPLDWARITTPNIVLSAQELATLFHLPAGEHAGVTAEASRRVPPPIHLLREPRIEQEPITTLGEALTREGPVPFGLRLSDRRLHTYLIGQTGTGKSTLLATLARQDFEQGRGGGLIDPHGDLAERVLSFVPPSRFDDVLYFNPADTEYPVGFNLLTATTPAARPLVASGVISVFKKLYPEFWGPRLEYILRHAILFLLETPAPSLLVLPRLLTDHGYRRRLLPYVRDPIVRSFFTDEFERYDVRFQTEALSPILNKVGQFLSSPVVRNIVGQREPGVNLRRIMDEGGIFVTNLAAGRIGEDAAALLGGLLMVGFQLAAMARADQAEEERRDFFLSVDEFQHFANDSFAGILAEARKYHLALTLSHQYLDQVPPGMSQAVLGNAANLGVFRLGAPDAGRLARDLAPAFDAQDLVHLPNHSFCARLTRDNAMLPAFSARTLPLPTTAADLTPLIERSRRRWGRPRAAVELEIADVWEGRVD